MVTMAAINKRVVKIRYQAATAKDGAEFILRITQQSGYTEGIIRTFGYFPA